MSHEKAKPTVEEYFAEEFPYLLMREMRYMDMKRERFAEYLGVSVEQLDQYRSGKGIPRSDTLIKIMSKLRVEFLADIFATVGIHDKYSIISNTNKLETGISIVEKARAK